MERLLNPVQAAKFLGLSPSSLAVYRSENRGPNYRRIGGRNTIRYSMEDLEDYARHKKIPVPKSELEKREFQPVFVLMTATVQGAPFGSRVFRYLEGCQYEVSQSLAAVFTQQLDCAAIMGEPTKDTYYLLEEGYRQIEQPGKKKTMRRGK